MTSNEYIIKFRRDILDISNTSEAINAFLVLEESSTKVPIIVVKRLLEEKNSKAIYETLLYKFVTKNFAKVEFEDDNRKIYLEYNDGYERSIIYRSLIEFDSSSSSAYSTFKESFEKLINSKLETKYYSSGRIKYTGETLEVEDEDSIYDGYGTLYYDTSNLKKKYSGDFENNEYDGSGIFYHKDSSVVLTANNISDGIPNQKGKLTINISGEEHKIEFLFSELWEDFNLPTRKSKRDFVSDDKFVSEVAKFYWPINEKEIDDICFEEKTLEEQNLILLNEIKLLRSEIKEIINKKPKVFTDALDNLLNAGKDMIRMVFSDLFLSMIRLGEVFIAMLCLIRFYNYFVVSK